MNKTPYERGHNAGMRIEEYEGYRNVPENPYPEGTPEYQQWEYGFGHGTEDYITLQTTDY